MHAKSQQNLAPTTRPRHPTVLSIPLLLNHSERSKSSQLGALKYLLMRNTAFPAQISAVCACTHTHSTAHPALLPLRAGLYQCHSILSFLLKAPNYLPRNLKPPKKHPHHLLCCYILLPEVAQTKQSESTSTKTSCPN